MPKLYFQACLALLASGFLSPFKQCLFAAEAWKPKEIEYFEKHIRPVLVKYCYECHSEASESFKGNLRVDHRDGLVSGGDSGPAMVPGDVDASLILSALRYEDFEMPPEGKLPDEVIAHFERWIRMGAPDPRSSTSSNQATGQAPTNLPFWAFQTPMRLKPPFVQDAKWGFSEIDCFVKAKLEAVKIEPVADADRTTLIRRAYFDLWGLPPAPADVERFVQDTSADAFAKVIDYLLESPHFGERWGRHWLDVARYGESTGHERNFLYPHAWRYRDYVINAFNRDKPYDRFVTEQLAGDRLPSDSVSERDEQLTATGFLALGARSLISGDQAFLFDTIDDQINVTTQAFLGMTVSCARCHDHKFDPVTTQEYYALAGIFYSTQTLYGTQPGTGNGNNRHPSELIPLGDHGEEMHAAVVAHGALVADLQKELGKAENVLKKLRSLPDKQLAEKQNELEIAQAESKKVKSKLEKLQRAGPPQPAYAMGVRDAKKIADTEVRISGDADKKGPLVPRGLLACCTDVPPAIPSNASARLELAQWLVNPKHPLTARVMVNRVWHHLMGRGLVPSVNDFGRNGQPPSHPELLDWLAVTFQDHDWSIKYLIRRIMLSRTYQLSAAFSADNFTSDPDNVLLWRSSPKRLDAEAIRDAMLVASGSLRPGAPDFGSVVATLGDGCLVRQIDAEKLKAHGEYRSVYLPAARFFEPENLQVFDSASSSLVVGDRSETNVPAQVLYLLNNEFVIEQAQATADRIERRYPGDSAAKVKFAYQLVLGRQPSHTELQRSVDYLRPMAGSDGAAAAGPTASHPASDQIWASFVQALFAGAEFRYVY